MTATRRLAPMIACGDEFGFRAANLVDDREEIQRGSGGSGLFPADVEMGFDFFAILRIERSALLAEAGAISRRSKQIRRDRDLAPRAPSSRRASRGARAEYARRSTPSP